MARIIPENPIPGRPGRRTATQYKPAKNPQVIHLPNRTAVRYPNIQIHPNPTTTQSEMSIVTHPTNPDIVLVASNAIMTESDTVVTGSQGWYYTTDGGKHWYGSDTIPTQGNSRYFLTDPAVGIDRDGNFFLNSVKLEDTADVVIDRSLEESREWERARVPDASDFEDKDHFAVDIHQTSPYNGNLYSVFTDFDSVYFPFPLLFSRSTDRGTSFSDPIPISGSIGGFFAQGGNIAIDRDGVIYATWSAYDSWPPPVQTRLGFSKSTDGGLTWTEAINIGKIRDIRGFLYKGGSPIRVNSFPSMTIDNSDGPRSGWIYIVYTERNVTVKIYLVRSSDGGETWSSPIQVNQDRGYADHWFPWATIDPATGGLYVVYYDSRNFVQNDTTEVYISSSMDGGDTFEDILVSDTPFLPAPIPGTGQGYMGDYIGIAALNGVVWPSWNDNRTGIHQAYVSRIVFMEIGRSPTLTVFPDTVAFDNIFVGYPDTVSINIRNMGYPDTLVVSAIGFDNSIFAADRTEFALAGGRSTSIKVSAFTGTAGTVRGEMTILSNDSAAPVRRIPLEARAVHPPQVTLDTDTLSFEVAVNDSLEGKFTLRNSGVGSLDFSVISVPFFIRCSPATGTIAPGETMNVRTVVRAVNIDGGKYAGMVRLRTNDPLRSEVAILVTMRAYGVPDLVLSRDTIDFGETAIGYGKSLGLVLSNNGTDTLAVTDVQVVDTSFALIGPSSFKVPPRRTQILSVRFTPAWEATVSGGIVLQSNDHHRPVMFVILSGVGVPPAFMTVIPDSYVVSMYRGDSLVTQTMISNQGPGTLRWTMADTAVDGGYSSLHAGAEPVLSGVRGWMNVFPKSGTLLPGRAIVLDLRLRTNGLTYGVFLDSLVILSNDPLQPRLIIPIRLSVLRKPNIALSRDTIDFGDVYIAYPETTTFTLTNMGYATIHVSEIGSNVDEFTVLGEVPFNIREQATCSISVRCLSSSAGSRNGTLTIRSDDQVNPVITVPVRAIGLLAPVIAAGVDSLPVITLRSGETAQRILQVDNRGGSDLRFRAMVRSSPGTIPMSIETGKPLGMDPVSPAFSAPGISPVTDVFLPITMTDGMGFRWDIQENGEIRDGSIDAFDGGLRLKGFGKFERARTEDDKREILIGPSLIGGVSVLRKIYIPENNGFARYLEVLMNMSSTKQSITVEISSNLGSDQDGTFALTSRGGSSLVRDDTWIVTDDADSSGDPTVVHIFRGSDGSLRPVTVTGGSASGVVGYSYTVTLSPGGRAIIMHFAAQRWNRHDAIVLADSLINIPEEAIVGMSLLETYQVLNFDINKQFRVSVSNHVVPAGASYEIPVTYHAEELTAGRYSALLMLESNDPARPLMSIPISMTVLHAPHLDAGKDTVRFRRISLGFTDSTRVLLYNSGSDTLRIEEAHSDNDAFQVLQFRRTILKPGTTYPLSVRFVPVSLGKTMGTLRIVSNDPMNPAVEITLIGDALSAAAVSTTPESLSVSLDEGQNPVLSFSFRNHGDAPLTYTVDPVISGLEETVIGTKRSSQAAGIAQGNIYYCARTTTLLEMGMYLDLVDVRDIEFTVYEAASFNGPYTRIYQSFRRQVPAGQGMISSGSIGVRLIRGRYYHLGTSIGRYDVSFIRNTDGIYPTSFGSVITGAESWYPLTVTDFDPIPLPGIMFYQSVVTGENAFIPILDPDSGTVSAHDSAVIDLTMREAMSAGTYLATVRIKDVELDRTVAVLPVRIRLVGENDPPPLPREYRLDQNYPNPFNGSTVLRYALPARSRVRLTVYNIIGQQIDVVAAGDRNAGEHTERWEPDVPSGVYLYRLDVSELEGSARSLTFVRKMIVLR